MSLSYISRGSFNTLTLIIFKDRIEYHINNMERGEQHELKIFSWISVLFYLTGAYAYLMRWVSYYYITNKANLIEYNNTMRHKKIPLVIFFALCIATFALLVLRGMDPTDKIKNFMRGYSLIGYIFSSILIQYFVHKFLNLMNIKFPLLYQEKQKIIRIYSISFSI